MGQARGTLCEASRATYPPRLVTDPLPIALAQRINTTSRTRARTRGAATHALIA